MRVIIKLPYELGTCRYTLVTGGSYSAATNWDFLPGSLLVVKKKKNALCGDCGRVTLCPWISISTFRRHVGLYGKLEFREKQFIDNTSLLKLKGEIFSHTMEACRGSRCVAPPILNLSTRWT